MLQFLELATGVIIATLLFYPVSWVVRRAAPSPNNPNDKLPQTVWEELTRKDSGGKWMGGLERYLSLAAFWTGNYSLIAGWLAFKVASKWEVWKNIVQVPDTLDGVSSLEWYTARNSLGSWILTRFWVGTLSNIVGGLVAAYAGSHSGRLWCLLLEQLSCK